jgi:Ras association domain-containing protein 9/10
LSHRLQQEQASKQTQQSQPVCFSKTLPIASEHRISNDDDNGRNDNDYDCTSGESDDESMELWSHELPVWIKGEQRWISGVTEQTTCLDLIEALLIDEGVIKATNDSNNNSTANPYSTKVNDYVIAERWRRVEQVLEPRTKILKIWAAWGAEQSEVSETLCTLIASAFILSQLFTFYCPQKS